MGTLEPSPRCWEAEPDCWWAVFSRGAPPQTGCGRTASGRLSRGQVLHRTIFLFLFLVGVAGVFAAAQSTSPAETALLARAQAFATHSRFDLAVQAWKQVLASDPENRQALAGIARAEMLLGRRQEAQAYLDRLRHLGGNAKIVQQIESLPPAQTPGQRLEAARRLAEEGHYADAMAIYHSLYGETPPDGDLALAYYDTEAAIPDERSRAVAGLRSLAQRFPADPRYAITLGRALTYAAATRPEGVAILQKYSDAAAARSALTQAQAWQKMAAAATKPRSTANAALAAAYRALHRGELSEARERFQMFLAKSPSDPRALSGMGYVQMKQGDFAAAEHWFERARAAGAAGLDGEITLARFWQRMNKGSAELNSGKTGAALEDLRAAVAIQPANPDALEALAGALRQAGENRGAANVLAGLVRQAPGRGAAWRGLFLSQSAAGDAQAALATLDRMAAPQRSRLEGDPECLRALAADELAAGRKDGYQQVVNRALGLCSPRRVEDMPVGARSQCADLLEDLHQDGAAAAVLQEMIAATPNNAPAWLTLISLQHQLLRDDAALATAASLPQPVLAQLSRDPRFLSLMGSIDASRRQWTLARGWFQRAIAASTDPAPSLELQLADVDLALGRTADAESIDRKAIAQHSIDSSAWLGLLKTLHQAGQDQEALRELASMPEPVRARLEPDPEFLRAKAAIQAATGHTEEAVSTSERLAAVYTSQGVAEPAGALLQSGWIYLNAGASPQLDGVMGQVIQRPQVGAEQRLELDHLLAVWSLRRASALAKAGSLHSAIALLEADMRVSPGEPGVQESLAGLYLQAGEAGRALAMFQSLNPNSAGPSQFQVAIGAAMAAGNKKQASVWLRSALRRFPNQAKVLKVAGDYEQSLGRSGQAERYYRRALMAIETPAPVQAAALAGVKDGETSVPQPQPADPTVGPMSGVQPLLQLLEKDEALNAQAAESLASARPAKPSGGRSETLSQLPENLNEQIRRQLKAIQSQFSPWIGATADGDDRSGQPGYSQLFAYSAESEESATLGTLARLTLIAGPIRLDSGTARGATTMRLGTLPANATPTPQLASGVAGELQLRADAFAASFGTTPRGFPVGNWTGGVLLQPASAHITVTLSRRSIQDSELSYAGLRDEGSLGSVRQGSIWGGVIANSGELQIASSGARSGWYLQGGFQYITGRHVPINRRADGDVGAYWTAWSRPTSGSLTIGMNFFGMHYAQNQYDFTYGQGGYFSPQAFAIAGVPVNLTGRSRRHWRYKLSGSLGVQGYYQATTPYFPLDPALQISQGNPYYPASTTIGANYNFDGELSYAAHHHWFLGTYAAFNNTREYAESKAGFFLRYVFAAQDATSQAAPTGLFPATGYRPLRVP
ncbi:MAG: cellulose synthase subunit BcsC-related outer membrane protein [Acidobacteriota bacterium]